MLTPLLGDGFRELFCFPPMGEGTMPYCPGLGMAAASAEETEHRWGLGRDLGGAELGRRLTGLGRDL